MVVFKLLERSIGLFSMIFLARLLMPADFGVVALATAIIAILEVFGAFSFDIALIQRADADSGYYNTAWTFNVIIGAAACLLVIALAQPTAIFYDEPRLRNLLYLLAFSPLAGSLENIGVVVYRKEMQFQKEFAFLLTKKLFTVALTLILAVTLRNYWALAIGILFGRTAGTLLSYIVNAYRPQFTLQRRRELMSFSVWSFLNNIMRFMSNRFGDFIIAKTTNPAALGVYNMSYEIATLPTTELVSPINRAVFSAYSQMTPREMKTGYLLVLDMVALLTIPAAFGIAASASTFVPLVLGDQWLAAVPVIEVLAFFGLIQALQNNIGSVYYALGIPKTLTLYALAYNVVMIPSLIVGSIYWGPLGAAVALLISLAIVTPFNMHNMSTKLELGYRDFIRAIWRPACAGTIMFFGVTSIQSWLQPMAGASNNQPLMSVLLILVVSGFLIYASVVILLWILCGRPSGSERTIIMQLRKRLSI